MGTADTDVVNKYSEDMIQVMMYARYFEMFKVEFLAKSHGTHASSMLKEKQHGYSRPEYSALADHLGRGTLGTVPL